MHTETLYDIMNKIEEDKSPSIKSGLLFMFIGIALEVFWNNLTHKRKLATIISKTGSQKLKNVTVITALNK